MNAFITVFYDWSRLAAAPFAWDGPLAVRIVVGWVFLWTGWQKLQNLPRMVENFRGWGIPAPEILTPLASGIEFVGGIMLLLGLLTRPHLRISPVGRQHLWVCAAFDDAAMVEYQYLRGIGNGRQAVRDHQRGTVARNFFKLRLNSLLRHLTSGFLHDAYYF